MSHFYGTVDGQAATTASRRGSIKTGVTTYAAGWSGAIRVGVWHSDTDDKDWYSVSLVPWQSSGGSTIQLAEGILDATLPAYEPRTPAAGAGGGGGGRG